MPYLDEEVEAARPDRQFFRYLRDCPWLSKSEEYALFTKYWQAKRDGDTSEARETRQAILHGSMRYIAWIAWQYAPLCSAFTFMDLVHELILHTLEKFIDKVPITCPIPGVYLRTHIRYDIFAILRRNSLVPVTYYWQKNHANAFTFAPLLGNEKEDNAASLTGRGDSSIREALYDALHRLSKTLQEAIQTAYGLEVFTPREDVHAEQRGSPSAAHPIAFQISKQHLALCLLRRDTALLQAFGISMAG